MLQKEFVSFAYSSHSLFLREKRGKTVNVHNHCKQRVLTLFNFFALEEISHALEKSYECVIACGQDSAIAYSIATAIWSPVVLASRSDEMAYVLCWDGSIAKSIPVEECTNTEGFTVKPEDDLGLLLLGVSNDGRYAAFIVIDTCDILMMDLQTLEVHTLLEYSTVSDTIAIPLMTRSHWDGGEYINTGSGYSLRFICD